MTMSLNVVLADDDKDDCFLFDEAVEELPLAVNLTIVNDGVELMQLLADATDNFPDVLFLDLNMPRKNGFECLSEIRGNNKLPRLPIIIFSTSFDPQVANQLYKKGAYYYMRKPSGFSNLRKAIHQALTQIKESTNGQPPKEKFVLTS